MKQKRKIVFATNNAHKLKEVRQMMGDAYEIVGLADIGCTEDIPEDGLTLEQNAMAKALYVSKNYGLDCFADDTGLEVEALNGAPGVHSARYAPGVGHDSQANMRLLLANLSGVANRNAQFRTVVALIEGEKVTTFDGKVEGEILTEPHGEGGFGYDPVFLPTGHSLTFAEMTAEQKNAISHRRSAVEKLKNYLEALENENK